MNQDVDLGNLEQKFADADWGSSALSRISFLKSFDEGQRSDLYRCGRVLKVKPETNIVIEGENSRGLFFLLFGLVSVYKTDRTGGGLTRLTNLHQWDVFGELSLIDSSPRSATVIATQGSYLFELPAGQFAEYLESQPELVQITFYQQIAAELVGRLRNLNEDYVIAQRMLWKQKQQHKKDAEELESARRFNS